MTSLEATPESEPLLATFLQGLLAGNLALVNVFHDDHFGVGKDDAQSYLPLPCYQRMSDASMPGLHRWESQCQTTIQESSSSSLAINNSPLLPMRRVSLDDFSDGEWSDFDDEEIMEQVVLQSIQEFDEEEAFQGTTNVSVTIEQADIFACVTETLLAVNAELNGPNNAPTDATKRRRRRHEVFSKASSTDPLAAVLSQGGRLLPNPVQLLERLDREASMMEIESEMTRIDELVVALPASRRKNGRDSLPCCARRRPSPQLEKALLLIDLAPNRAVRRPSPAFEQCLVDAISFSVSESRGSAS